MLRWVSCYLASLAAMATADSIWLTFTAERLYRAHIGPLLAADFRLAPAIAFYLIYVAGLVVLAVQPNNAAQTSRGALALGAIYGLCAYGAYDLTNQATLRIWSTTLTLADMAWGALLSAFAAAIGAYVTAYVKRT